MSLEDFQADADRIQRVFHSQCGTKLPMQVVSSSRPYHILDFPKALRALAALGFVPPLDPLSNRGAERPRQRL